MGLLYTVERGAEVPMGPDSARFFRRLHKWGGVYPTVHPQGCVHWRLNLPDRSSRLAAIFEIFRICDEYSQMKSF